MKKLIGVCITETRSEFSREFINNIFKYSIVNNFKVIIYNSICNFSNEGLRGARAVYYNIPYDKLSAIVIVHDCFNDPLLIDKIIRYAKEAGTPVIMARKYDPRCYSIIGDYQDTYKEMLKKVIKDRNIKDTLYLAGRNVPEIDYNSKLRIQCYKDALEECDLQFDPDNILFGNYTYTDARNIFEKKLARDEIMPDAIFCANDRMAQSVMEVLKSYGYRVPRDLVVTGFDGMECYECSFPRLTTCKDSLADLCATIFSVAKEIEKGAKSGTYYYSFKPIYSKSCGYDTEEEINAEKLVHEMYSTLRNTDSNLYESGKWSGVALYKSSLSKFYSLIDSYVKPNFSVAMTPLEVAQVINKKYHALEDSMILYSIDKISGLPRADKYITKQIVPDYEDWIKDDTMYFVTAIMVEDICYGLIYEKGYGNNITGYLVHDHAATLIKVLTASAKEDL